MRLWSSRQCMRDSIARWKINNGWKIQTTRTTIFIRAILLVINDNDITYTFIVVVPAANIIIVLSLFSIHIKAFTN